MSREIIEISEKVAPRCSKYFFDHSKVRFTANPKLALRAQTLNLRPFGFNKNGYRKNLNSRSELPSQRPLINRAGVVELDSNGVLT